MAKLQVLIITTLFNMLVSLITGKFLKKLVMLIVEPIVRRTKNKADDKLLDAAKEDLGISEDK